MKLDARWALPVYPVLKAQSHEKMWKHLTNIKKHNRTSPEIQFKELNEKLRRTLRYQQINWTMQARTQKSSKNWETKRIKTKQKHSLLKLSKLLNLRQNFFPLKTPITKICSKPTFVSEIGPVLYLQDLKNIHWPLKID